MGSEDGDSSPEGSLFSPDEPYAASQLRGLCGASSRGCLGTIREQRRCTQVHRLDEWNMDPKTMKPCVKIYADKENELKTGDALILYTKEEYVASALRLDGTPLRTGDKINLSVTQAIFKQKGGNDDSKCPTSTTVVLRHMFSLPEIRANPDLEFKLEADVREECSKFGRILSVKVCVEHPHGAVLVQYENREDGLKCIDLMNGTWCARRQIHAGEDDGSVDHYLLKDLDLDAESCY